jgi:glycosyltransferase involved in cell wall biosynthesis
MAKICVIRQWFFPEDPRVSREIRALIRAGHEVDLICVGRPGQARFERDKGIAIWRLPIARRRGSPLQYLFEFTAFPLAAALFAGALHLRRRFDVVQVNSLPDWLVFAAIVPRLLGARVLLDMHDPMPEYVATKYKLGPRHPAVRLLAFLEQASIRFAHSVVTCTEQMRERFVERGAPRDKITVVFNAFDEETFDTRPFLRNSEDGDGFLLVSHGTIDENYGLDVIVRAVGLLKDRIPQLRLKIYGDGNHRASVEALTRELGLEDRVWFSRGFLPMQALMPRIAEADAGVVATRRDPFRDLTHCNKMYDLITLRKPVIISRTRAVEACFGDGCFQMFESGDERDLARAIHDLYADPQLRRRLVRRATEIGEPYRWVHQQARYLETIGRLIRRPGARGRRRAVAAEAGESRPAGRGTPA